MYMRKNVCQVLHCIGLIKLSAFDPFSGQVNIRYITLNSNSKESTMKKAAINQGFQLGSNIRTGSFSYPSLKKKKTNKEYRI